MHVLFISDQEILLNTTNYFYLIDLRENLRGSIFAIFLNFSVNPRRKFHIQGVPQKSLFLKFL